MLPQNPLSTKLSSTLSTTGPDGHSITWIAVMAALTFATTADESLLFFRLPPDATGDRPRSLE